MRCIENTKNTITRVTQIQIDNDNLNMNKNDSKERKNYEFLLDRFKRRKIDRQDNDVQTELIGMEFQVLVLFLFNFSYICKMSVECLDKFNNGRIEKYTSKAFRYFANDPNDYFSGQLSVKISW